MPFYLTRNPVPSADMRDVFDNAQNLDLALNNMTSAIWTDRFGRSRMSWYGLESAFSLKLTDFETRFTAQITEQANEFEAAQAAQEDSFQESLLKIGYESLDDYVDGPLTFTRRNQITAYNGEFYRPKASVSLPYTTTGNTDSSWETDKDNFVVVGDAALRQELASDSGTLFVGKFLSVSELSTFAASTGQTAEVKSYLEGGMTGGGTFIYDSSQAAINDGVVVFNGWVRQRDDKILTSYDAGIIPNDGHDATTELETFLNNIPDGWTAVIMGYHQTSGPITFKGRNGITIQGQYGTISGYERRSSWVWGSDADFENGSGNLGILSWYGCKNTIVENLIVDGAHLQRPDSKEWGDCMFRYESSPGTIIRNCTGTGFGGWGIFGLYSDYSKAYFNNISKVSRQSGINVFACSSHCEAYGNLLNDVGLYGIEMETLPAKTGYITESNKAYDNITNNSKYGVCIVSSHNNATVYNNKSYNCLTGVFAIKYTGNNLKVFDNIAFDSMRAVQINASQNVTVANNTLHVNTVPGYVIYDQYQAVISISSDRLSFYSIDTIKSGYSIQIRGVSYTISASVQDSSRTDYGAQSGGLYLNTLTSALNADVEHCDNVYLSVSNLSISPYGFAANNEGPGYNIADSTSNLVFLNNNSFGKISAACFTNSQYSDVTTIKERWVDNGCYPSSDNPYTTRWMRFNQGCNAAIHVQNMKHDKLSSIYSSATGGSTLNIFGNRYLNFQSSTPVTSGSVFLPHYFVSESPFAIVAIKVTLYNFSGTEDLYLGVNGTSSNVKIAVANSTSTAITYYSTRQLFFTLSAVGPLYVRLFTASNTASVTSYSIEIETL